MPIPGATGFAHRQQHHVTLDEAGKYFVNFKTGSDRLDLSRQDLDALMDQLEAAA